MDFGTKNIIEVRTSMQDIFEVRTSIFLLLYLSHSKTRNFWFEMMRKLSVT